MINEKNRNSNFELLKILLIIMVIILHYLNRNMGGILGNVNKSEINYYISHFLESLCIIAVNTFVIITGYFSCKKKEIKISKVIKLYAISIFYGIVISAIVILITKRAINLGLLMELFKATFCRWYIVTYCILYLLIPFINKLISVINQKELMTIIIINTIVFYLFPTFLPNITIKDGGYGITNFINLYLIGSYIKLYVKNYKSHLFLISYIVCTIITTIYSFFSDKAWSYATILNLISSISLFILFLNIKVKNNNTINNLASYTLAIYIIHENQFLTKILYHNLFKSNLYWNSNYMIINLLYTTLGIFLICVIIEFIRRILLKKIFDNKIDEIKYKIECN